MTLNRASGGADDCVLLASGGSTEYVKAWMQQAGHRDDQIFQLDDALFMIDFISEHGPTFNGNHPPSMEREQDNLTRAFGEAFARIDAPLEHDI
jgi:hypothetical protein